MPEMEKASNFPNNSDNLSKIPFAIWKKFIFASLKPKIDFSDFIKPLERINFLPFDEFKFDSKRSRDYLVNANWALYVENYLEGFHIPYVHPGLAKELDYNNYRTELFDYCSLQVGITSGSENVFELPKEHLDFGQQVAAYYFWLFPNLMLNFYPWGLSINIIKPITIDRTRVVYQTYVWKEELIDIGAGAQLDRVEREDEEIVEQVQKGVQSRYYKKGRYSPTQEKGVHHFHKLLMNFLNN
jgi:choline monooxygenase